MAAYRTLVVTSDVAGTIKYSVNVASFLDSREYNHRPCLQPPVDFRDVQKSIRRYDIRVSSTTRRINMTMLLFICHRLCEDQGVRLPYTEVEDVDADNLHDAAKADHPEEEAPYEDTDVVRVSIVLNKKDTLELYTLPFRGIAAKCHRGAAPAAPLFPKNPVNAIDFPPPVVV